MTAPLAAIPLPVPPGRLPLPVPLLLTRDPIPAASWPWYTAGLMFFVLAVLTELVGRLLGVEHGG